ncbi:MAG: sulfurtransferase complex subunit TusB [Pseudomonadota bacterium]
MLHIVNKSPFEKNSLASCLRLSAEESTILLIEDAVYAALVNTSVSESVHRAMDEKRIVALEPDLAARGFDANHLINGVELVDYDGFVTLTVDNPKIQSWL